MAVIEREPETVEAPAPETDPVIRELQRAIRVLERDGWCQGRFRDDDTGERCLVGALRDEYRFPDAEHPDREAALNVVVHLLGSPNEPSEWNDDPGRTYPEVRGLLERAIEHRREVLAWQ